MKNYSIILASGTGSRYGSTLPKQFIRIEGKTILEHTIEVFEQTKEIDEIIVVITPEYRYLAEDILKKSNFKKITKLLNGGETRKDSSFIGISSIHDEEANVIIHDCARPFVTQKIITDCIEALNKYDAIDVAIPSSDTIMEVENNIIVNIPDRKNLKRAQTPQCFKLSLIKKAHELSKGDSNFTDDCGLILKYNLSRVAIVEGSIDNIKITYPNDIFMAEKLLQDKKSEEKNRIKTMKRVITYGTFDVLHYGHINLLKRAKELGDYLIVVLSSDEFNMLKNKKSYYTYEQRKMILEACRYVDLVIPENNWEQKIDDVKTYKADIFVMGDDWKGKFDFLKDYCEVVYLPRTPDVSSTQTKEYLKNN